jgi:hypothetical protein
VLGGVLLNSVVATFDVGKEEIRFAERSKSAYGSPTASAGSLPSASSSGVPIQSNEGVALGSSGFVVAAMVLVGSLLLL